MLNKLAPLAGDSRQIEGRVGGQRDADVEGDGSDGSVKRKKRVEEIYMWRPAPARGVVLSDAILCKRRLREAGETTEPFQPP